MLSLSPQWLRFRSSMSFSTLLFLSVSLTIVRSRVVHLSAVGRLDAWEINDAVQNLSEFIPRPWSILATLLPLHLYCNDLSFLETAAICKKKKKLRQTDQWCLQIQQVGCKIIPDKSRSPPAPRDPQIDIRRDGIPVRREGWVGGRAGGGSWRPESALCILRCLLINLDSFQQSERPTLVHLSPHESESWPNCHFSTQFCAETVTLSKLGHVSLARCQTPRARVKRQVNGTWDLQWQVQ